MRISLLLRREPFGKILEQTLASHWSHQFDAAYDVSWHGPRDDSRGSPSNGGERWVCNTLLNAIFVPGVDSQAFGPVRREFARSPKLWRRPFQWPYVQVATRRPLAARLAQATLTVTPPVPGSEHLLVLGGNHRVRVLDHHHERSYVITKSGFSTRYMHRELKVRRNPHGLPLPELLEAAPDDTWFVEEYIVGTPINRLGATAAAQHALHVVSEALQLWQETAVRPMVAQDYAAETAHDIGRLLEKNRWLGEEERGGLRQDLAMAMRLVSQSVGQGAGLETVQSHGDFQPANVLADGDRAWLIDWEYTGRRQRAYDPLTFALRSRFPAGLAKRVRQALERTLPGQELLERWPGLRWTEASARTRTLAVFLLEELAHHLEEADNSLFYGLTEGLFAYRPEMRAALSVLEQHR